MLWKLTKQSFCSATCFGRCVAFFSLNTAQFRRACWPLHTEHGRNFGFSLFLSLTFALLATTFVPTFCFTWSSDLTLELIVFNLSWPSAFSLSHSLKSSRVGRSHWRLTVCIDHACLRFGRSLLTAWFSKLTLFMSSLKDRDLNTATSPETVEETFTHYERFQIGKTFIVTEYGWIDRRYELPKRFMPIKRVAIELGQLPLREMIFSAVHEYINQLSCRKWTLDVCTRWIFGKWRWVTRRVIVTITNERLISIWKVFRLRKEHSPSPCIRAKPIRRNNRSYCGKNICQENVVLLSWH